MNLRFLWRCIGWSSVLILNDRAVYNVEKFVVTKNKMEIETFKRKGFKSSSNPFQQESKLQSVDFYSKISCLHSKV